MANTTTTVDLILRAKDEASAALAHISGALEGIRGHLEGIRGIGSVALGTIIGSAAIGGVEELTRGVVDFGKSMIETNADIELMRQRLNILYQSTAEGAQAFSFLKQNELTKPFDISSIMQASVQLVAFKQDITTVLPALEDVAGAMGQSLPKAAQAFTDAMAGRFAMMKRDLGISKEELVQFGLKMNNMGHVTDPNSFVTAFLALAQSNQFKGGADKMAQTWTGLMSSMSSQWTYFKANLGAGAFGVLEQQLHGLVHTLQDPANAAGIQHMEEAIGRGLASATVAVINFGRMIGPWLGSAIIVGIGAWNVLASVVGAAIGFIRGVVGTFTAWFGSSVAPTIYLVLGTIAEWWQTHGNQVRQAVSFIWDRVREWVNLLVGGMRAGWNFIAADVKTLWDVVQGVWSAGGDLLSGNWSQLKDDLIATTRTLAADMVRLIGMMVGDINAVFIDVPQFMAHAIIAVIPAMGGPLNGIISAFNQFVQAFKGPIAVLAGFMGMAFTPFVDAANIAINAVMASLRTVIDHVPDFVLSHTPHGKDIKKSIDSFKGLALPTPDDGFNTAYNAVQGFKGINNGKPLDFTKIARDLGVGVDDIANTMKKFGVTGLQGMMDDIAAWLDPKSRGGEKTKSTAAKLGKEIIDNLLGAFKGLGGGLGGGLTMADFLKKLGIVFDTGGATPSFNGRLPVSGPGPTADAAAGGAAGAAGQRAVTGRVALGNLGATFMSNVASLAAIGQGTDPATRAAQQNASLAQQSVNQGTRSLTYQEQMLAAQHTTINRIEALLQALTKAAVPTATPPDPMRRLAVARPRVS